MRIGKHAPAVALGIVLLLAGCAEECNAGGSSWDGGAPTDEACAATRAELQGLNYWIAFDSNRDGQNRDIYAMRPNGEDVRRLTTEGSVERNPKFSPDGKKIVFVSDRSGESALYLLDLATKEEFGPISRAGADFPDWSPDGERIAFTMDHILFDVRPDGSNERRLADYLDLGIHIEHPVYSSDGKHILWDTAAGDGIVRCNADGSGCDELWPWETALWIRDAPSPDPNGISVALRVFCGPESSDPEDPRYGGFYNSAIYVIPWNGSEGRLNETGSASVCDFGTRLTPPVEGSYYSNPRWGPGFIAMEIGELNRVIGVMAVAASTPCHVTEGPFDDRNPAWSPEGAFIPASAGP